MSLDKQIEIKKEALYQAINNNGMLDKYTIKVSQELDILIVKKVRKQINTVIRRTTNERN